MKLFFFWSPKNDMKVGKICIKFSWNSNISVQRCLILYFNGPFFCCPIFFEDISPLPPPSQDQQNGKYSVNTTFVFQDWSQGCIFHISINSLRNYLSPECLLNILRNLYIPPWLGKIFKLMLFTFLENALNLGLFTHVLLSPHPPQELPPIFIRKNKDDLEH